MQTQSQRQPARSSRSAELDRRLSIEDIEGAFAKAGLMGDYRTLVQALGESALERSMTQRWLDLTIHDLLASQPAPAGAPKTRASKGHGADSTRMASSRRAPSGAH